ncbi:folate-binding protein [Spirulina major CS-329]|uniref:CAF17-like 4Fe-4S cluster assembly/insertion protein YgfZ n=1 Tax=Spirulina TaxID=1154 RepID=UPI00232EA3E2|nr:MULTISPECIES: folate-binding protein [Spirulina]MDB9494797.1 folate-binding protein [Spirulina subsalsa CS-330]MDB9501633.1 folate-binding protein [Spirulina major CS-329]
MTTLHDRLVAAGAQFDAVTPSIPWSFGNEAAAQAALETGAVICDRTHWDKLQITGEDAKQFLHNQTTNAIAALQPGQGCETVFVNSTARTLDLATVLCDQAGLWLELSPGQAQPLAQWMDRYIFPMDRVAIADVSADYALLTLMGPNAETVLADVVGDSDPAPPYSHRTIARSDFSLRLVKSTGLDLPGYTLWVPVAQAADLWDQLTAAGAVPMGDRLWQTLRIRQGRPQPGTELTDDYNPLEAGLWRAVSFTKGCYIGQETIARLNTYQGVKQRLWQINLPGPVAAETPILVAGAKVGRVTSAIATEGGAIALGYVRTKAGGAGLTVQIGDLTGELVPAPYLSHDYYKPQPATSSKQGA